MPAGTAHTSLPAVTFHHFNFFHSQLCRSIRNLSKRCLYDECHFKDGRARPKMRVNIFEIGVHGKLDGQLIHRGLTGAHEARYECFYPHVHFYDMLQNEEISHEGLPREYRMRTIVRLNPLPFEPFVCRLVDSDGKSSRSSTQ